MSTLPANPLQALLAQAAKAPTTTGESAQYKARHDASGPQIIICDVSGSMNEGAGGGKRRIDHLRAALAAVAGPADRILAFSSTLEWVQPGAILPEPSGSTALHLALRAAAAAAPGATIVISDGQPDSREDALAAAAALPGVISTLYCGAEGDADAVEFMRRLARLGCGRYQTHAWRTAQGAPTLGRSIQLLLR